MKTEWDYTSLADAYLARPEYSPEALEKIFSLAGLKAGDHVCDVGAGVAHLTIPLAQKGYVVDAVEPNDAMRANGQKRTTSFDNVTWFEGTGEATGRPADMYDFVSFGSSFNVCDRQKALIETHRLLKSCKWFACMWNHRQLDDVHQAKIESIIKAYIPSYGYGTRREDQTDVINASGLFSDVQKVEGSILHIQTVESTIEAWRSHATLQRQAGAQFGTIIGEIEAYLLGLHVQELKIPYTTRAWVARRK